MITEDDKSDIRGAPDGENLPELAIGSFIRRRRTELGKTLKEVAQECNYSVSYLSQVERGVANPTLSSIKHIGHALDFTIGELLSADMVAGSDKPSNGEEFEDPGFAVSRIGSRKRIRYPGSEIGNDLLSPNLRRQMEVIWVEAPAGASSGGHPHIHEGEECGVVLSGRMRFWVNETEIVLEEGDSIYLSSTLPHRWESIGPDNLTALWVITPPTF
jgi:transcriptional regulator with XRE-family HTH domain